MSQESELQRLEKFVEKLLVNFSELKTEKERLDQQLQESEQKVEELQDVILSKIIEREEISERVNKIVDQIEEWELSLDDGPTKELVEDSVEVDEQPEEEEAVKVYAEDVTNDQQEGRFQHNHFS